MKEAKAPLTRNPRLFMIATLCRDSADASSVGD